MSTSPATHLSPARSLASAPDAQRKLIPVRPSDLRPLEPVPVSTADEVRAVVQSARRAQQSWKLRSLEDRISLMKKAAKAMLARRAEVTKLAQDEMGKVEVEGIFNETLGPLDAIGGWASVLRRAARTRKVSLNPVSFPGKRAKVEQIPRGVVGIIAPWNFPVAGLYRSVFAALMSGNAVVLKPSEFTPRTSAWLIEVLASVLPTGVAQVVQGDGQVGEALIDAGIDACVFTGSPKAGRLVRLHCAERAIPSSIEMGGKDPAIVLADCDLERTVAGITHWALSNAGQACGAIEIAYVDEQIADRFIAAVRKIWTQLRTGPIPFADIGPMGNQRQFDVVVAQLADAKTKGAQVVCGGEPTGTGLFIPPTLLDRCRAGMAVVDDETFGPVLAVVRVSGAEEAIRLANEGRYGLGASIWTQDLARGERLAERLEVGMVTINNHAFTGAIPALPWSGTRASGFGIANGPESLGTFLRPRTVVVDQASSPELWWLPYDREIWEFGDTLADVQRGAVANAWKLPLLLRARLKTLKRFFY